jgi:AraC-like DNA-binding protein
MPGHSVLAALDIGVLEAAGAIGLDVAALSQEAGIDPSWLSDPDNRVPLENHLRLWEVLARRGDGLALGRELGMAGMGVVGYAMQHGTTVGEAYDWLWRYRAVIHPDVVPRMERRSEPAGERIVFARPVPLPFARLREPVYAQAAAIVAAFEGLSGTTVPPARVTFPMARPDDSDRHESFFACPVAWGGDELEVAFDASILDLPVPRSDARLFSYLARRADELLAALASESSHADRARREIVALLPQGEPRLGVVAARMAVSERTLHRRLSEEGTRFALLVDDARRERALLLLEDRSLSCSEIAFLLGYSDPAAFFRAFKRWTGVPPQEYRERPTTPGASNPTG